MRLLFVKDALAWPRSSGHDLLCFYLMQALARQGHKVGLVTAVEPAHEALAGLPLALQRTFPRPGEPADGPAPRLSRLQERFRSYWGIDPNRLRALGRAAEDFDADVVVVVGLNVLPYLGGVHDRLRVWYAADEWIWHHLSQLRLMDPGTWGNVRAAVVKGLYEWAYAPLLDRVWVASEADRRAMNWVTGIRAVDVLPTGVDSEYYQPSEECEVDNSCVFWGRLDFGPNIQALQWFCRAVWPALRRRVPGARLTIYGFKPTEPVQALADRDGVTLIADQADIRADIRSHQVVVLPFVSGGGVKSKLLEALSMGRAVVGTPRACNGLFGGPSPPLLQARSPGEWVRDVQALWSDAGRRKLLGATARRWVLQHHTWQAAARQAAASLERSLREARR